jgi:hypothetical protein
MYEKLKSKGGYKFIVSPDDKIVGIRGDNEEQIALTEGTKSYDIAEAYNNGDDKSGFTDERNFRGSAFLKQTASVLSDIYSVSKATAVLGGGNYAAAAGNTFLYYGDIYKGNLEAASSDKLDLDEIATKSDAFFPRVAQA